jgi:acetolactate synthase-1/3 small subunit
MQMSDNNGRYEGQELQTFVVYVEDKPGVLNRVASLFRRRAFNIASLTVGHTERSGVSRLTIVVEADDMVASRIEANLYKLINVLYVENLTAQPLIKVDATPETRHQVIQITDVFRARVVDVATDSVIVEVTGTADKIDGIVEVLRPYGIIEMVRTGLVAMNRRSNILAASQGFVMAGMPEGVAAD